jgi:general secretion pathway protein K
VLYEFDDAALKRGVYPVLDRAPATAPEARTLARQRRHVSPALPRREQSLVAHMAAVTRDAVAGSPDLLTQLPRAVEFRIGSRDYGEVAGVVELVASWPSQAAHRDPGIAVRFAPAWRRAARRPARRCARHRLNAGLLESRRTWSCSHAQSTARVASSAYAQGLEAYAAQHPAAGLGAERRGADSNGSNVGRAVPATPVPGGTIAATMRDRNGCFNLNNLVDAGGAPNPPWLDKFRRLLTALRLDPNLADAVGAWLDSRPGNEDPYYLAQSVAYRAAKRQFIHVSELRLVKGVSGDVYAALAPHVCALPRGTRINVNTASVPVLMTLSGITTEQLAERVWQEGHANYPDLVTLQSIVPGIQSESLYLRRQQQLFSGARRHHAGRSAVHVLQPDRTSTR